jgi:hypothetical protein
MPRRRPKKQSATGPQHLPRSALRRLAAAAKRHTFTAAELQQGKGVALAAMRAAQRGPDRPARPRLTCAGASAFVALDAQELRREHQRGRS